MRALIAMIILTTTACSSSRTLTTQDVGQPPLFTLKMSANRELELESCGCSMRNLGGAVREGNLHQEWKKTNSHPSLYVQAGTTFVPGPSLFKAAKKSVYQKKALQVVRALNELGVDVISPSAQDFSLGTDFVLSLKNTAKFQLVSTNIFSKTSGKPFLPAFAEKTIGGTTFVFVGLSGPIPKGYGVEKVVEVREAEKSLREVKKQFEGKNALFVLLTNLPRTEQKRLVQKLPWIHLVVGGTPDESFYGAKQVSPSSLLFNPESLGRNVTFLTFPLPTKLMGFVSPEAVSTVESLQNYVDEMEDKTKKKRLLEELAQAKKIASTPGATTYHSVSEAVSAAFEGQNSLTPIVEEFIKLTY